jgi:PAS domain S-box-containing protein
MTTEINYLKNENDKLIHDKDELSRMLTEANEVISAIKSGNIDAVFIASNETAKMIVTKIADRTYRNFIENMSEGVVSLHEDGTILYSNSNFAMMVNLPLQKIIGANFRKFIPAEYIDNFEVFFNVHDSNSKIELSLLNHIGLRLHFIVSFNRLLLHDYEVLNLVMTDVTSLKKAEEKLIIVNRNLKAAIDKRKISEKKILALNKELETNIKVLKDANTELETFAYIASHDLQEPLRKIMTYCSLLIRDCYDSINQEGHHYINTIRNSSEHMRMLITDILEYSGLSHKYSFEITNIEATIKEVLLNLEIIIKEKKASITVESSLPYIEANAGQMRQLFQNILSNSLKFVKKGVDPVINISFEILNGSEIEQMAESRFNEKFCKYYIRDNGIGFNQVYNEKIFTIFQRLNNSSAYKGTGIGLAICKKVVEQHHGFMTAESKVNEGALFTIILPFVQQHEEKNDQQA